LPPPVEHPKFIAAEIVVQYAFVFGQEQVVYPIMIWGESIGYKKFTVAIFNLNFDRIHGQSTDIFYMKLFVRKIS
jgi:hypothetical protein